MPLIGRFLEGYNVTILAYGQTSSGKSYTMGTAVSDMDFESLVAGQRPDPQTGIIPRAVAQIFSQMKASEAARGGAIQYTAKASFIEIYNEELIDLLADGEGENRPLVQIREDKAGTIIWSGLKEVRVQNVADVMNRLLQGSSIRRTNETDMNAQSSRSHAIFTLTLTQRKYTGNNPLPLTGRPASSFGMRSQTPTGLRTPTGRSSALPRPASSIPGASSRLSGALSSPGRSSTPGGGTAFGLRPASVISNSGRASPIVEDRSGGGDSGEWVTVTSKFHFVDLAGSERLKRTAAQGERVKEGISINAGLHALGNVISALGDPAKSKRTTHIPYRDSKLTRLLQDSLGGNAHTLMIACVSPTEYNVSETINTLQYANRARNIKNKAEINEVEIGWDDIEYLQHQLLKLRKEMQLLKGFKAGTPGSDAAIRAMSSRDALEWQAKYASLSQKYSQLTAEAVQLQQQSSRGHATQEDYYKAAEPIIIEYEKTVDALEGQINLQKAALGHCEDVILASENLTTEQEEKLASMEKELEGREETIVELQARLTKLEDRESTAEAYARDLESRLAIHTSNGVTEATVVAELKKEMFKLKESDGSREQYIKDLESRLTKSEESTKALQEHIGRLEKEAERREEAYKDLQQRIEMLDNSQETKQLVKELDARDVTVMELQAKLDLLQSERDEIARERGRLTDAAASRQLERGNLEDKIRDLESKMAASSSTALIGGAGLLGAGVGAAAEMAVFPSHHHQSAVSAPMGNAAAEEEISFLQTQVEMLSEELKSRQETSTKLQGEMENVNIKYKEALAEIQELGNQLSDARTLAPNTPDDREYLTPGESPSLSRRGSYNFGVAGSTGVGRSRGRPESLLLDNSSARRMSLSRRSSNSFLGYNPKEGTPREGTTTPTMATQASQQAKADGSPTLFRTRSLSQSLGPGSSTGGKRMLSLSGSADFAKLGFAPQQETNGLASPGQSPVNYERKIASLEAETLRLQDALKERDEEIVALERETRKLPNTGGQTILNPVAFPSKDQVSGGGLRDEHSSDVDELMRAMARKETDSRQQVEELTAEIQLHKKEKEASQSLFENQMANMVNEIETLRNREVDLATELDQLKADYLQREQDALAQHQQLTESLQETHANVLYDLNQNHSSILKGLNVRHENELQEAVKNVQAEQQQQRSVQLETLSKDHEDALSLLEVKHRDAVSRLTAENSSSFALLQSEHATALASAIEGVHQQHVTSLGETEAETAQRQMEEQQKIKQDHASQLEKLQSNHVSELEESRNVLQNGHLTEMEALVENHRQELNALCDQHQKELDKANALQANASTSHEGALALLQEQHSRDVQDITQNHARTLQSIQDGHSTAMQSLQDEHIMALQCLQDEHASNLNKLASEHEAAITQAKEEHSLLVAKLHDEMSELKTQHAVAIEASNGERNEGKRDLERLQQNHLHTLEQLEALKAEHSERLRSLTDEHASRVDELESNLQETITTRNALAKTHEELQDRHAKLVEQEPFDIDALRLELAETSDALVTLEGALTEAQEERDRLLEELEGVHKSREMSNNEVVKKEPAQAQKEIELLQATLANVRSELQRSKSDIQGMLQDKTRQESSLREMQIKLTIAETRSASHHGKESTTTSPSTSSDFTNSGESLRSPAFRREVSDGETGRGNRSLGIGGPGKPPPLTPPPNMPPPPTPSSNGTTTPTQQHRNSTGIRSSTSSSSLLLHNRPDSPNGTLTRSSSSTSIHSPIMNGLTSSDPKVARLLSDQAEELKNLAKQLNHCEMDLQANIDLVATLEAALNDSERNLRKSRVQLSEATRERDRYAMQADELRSQVTQAQQETDSVRNSVIVEKQGYESRLQMEREAKDKARRALEARLDEVQKKKNGKLFCM